MNVPVKHNFDDTNNIDNIINEIETAFFDIPFGNSTFQVKNFILGQSITPERAYRSIGLELLNVLRRIKTQIFDMRINEVKTRQKKEKLSDPGLDKFEREILELELLKDANSDNYGKKLLNDAIVDFEFLYNEFKKYPKFTREQFEQAEQNYYTQSLERQAAGVDGPVAALINIRDDVPALERYKEQISGIEAISSELLETLRLSMDNQMANAKKKATREEAEYQAQRRE